MNLFIVFVFIVIFLIFFVLLIIFRKNFFNILKFFSAGFDSGFKLKEIYLLRKLGKYSSLDEPTALFWSIPTLDKSIAIILKNAKELGKENDDEIQNFLLHVYSYRTKVEFNQKKYNKGIISTKEMLDKQKLRIVVNGRGVFDSNVLLNTQKELAVSLPFVINKNFNNIVWEQQSINIFFKRKNDASYFFRSTVYKVGKVHNESALYIQHSDSLVRAQKRKSIRVPCGFYAQLYIKGLNSKVSFEPCEKERTPGLRCFLENISENGALVRIGGKGVIGMVVKIQFVIEGTIVIMSGIVCGLEYNKQNNRSLLHIKGCDLTPKMKNIILSFVYNVIPKDEINHIDTIEYFDKNKIDQDSYDIVIDNHELENNNNNEVSIEDNKHEDTVHEIKNEQKVESVI